MLKLPSRQIRFDTKPSKGALLQWSTVHTVCEESRCPNRSECFSRGTATFLIGGELCTRNCGFCSVKTGKGRSLREIAGKEASDIVEHVQKHGLEYVVLTSVTRDDDEQGLADHFASLIRTLRSQKVRVETLIPDFHARPEFLEVIARARPSVISHNLETVERLTTQVRSVASYETSLHVFKTLREIDSSLLLKSGLMVGLGETMPEIREALEHLFQTGVRLVTVGQYLQPDSEKLSVQKVYSADEFSEIEKMIRQTGYKGWKTGPFVRSSYFAETVYEQGGRCEH